MEHRFTRRDQLTYIKWNSVQLNDSAVLRNIAALRRSNTAGETEFLSTELHCPLPIRREILANMDTFQPGSLAESAEMFQDQEIMAAIRCTLDGLLHRKNQDFPTEANQWLQRLVRLTESLYSRDGDVYSTEFFHRDIFVIKAGKPSREVNLRHELAVGLILNTLRWEIPNFVYTYSGFMCSSPELCGSQVTEWCTRRDPAVEYLLLENVGSGLDLTKYLRDSDRTLQEILEKVLQITLALAVAHQRHRFAHFDLHGHNILLRSPNEELQIPYWVYTAERDPVMYSLRTTTLAIMIDFGMSTIELPRGQQVAAWDNLDYALPANNPLPVVDLYRVAFYIVSLLYDIRSPLHRELLPMLEFFLLDPDLEDDDHHALAWVVPVNKPRVAAVNHLDFVEYLRERYPQETGLFLRRTDLWPGVPVYGCHYEQCSADIETALAQFGLSSPRGELGQIYRQLSAQFDLADPANDVAILRALPPATYAAILERTVVEAQQSRREYLSSLLDRYEREVDIETLEEITSILHRYDRLRDDAAASLSLEPIYHIVRGVPENTARLRELSSRLVDPSLSRRIENVVNAPFPRTRGRSALAMLEELRLTGRPVRGGGCPVSFKEDPQAERRRVLTTTIGQLLENISG